MLASADQPLPPPFNKSGSSGCLVRHPGGIPVIADEPKTGTMDAGSTCTYEDEYGTLSELIADTTLTELPKQLRDSEVDTFTFADDFPARRESTADSCSVAIDTGGDQVVAVTFINSGEACRIAQNKLAASITGLLRAPS